MVTEGVDIFEASQIADEKLPRMIELGELGLAAVRQSEYFFAYHVVPA